MVKLGKNLGSYLGETIDIAAVLAESEQYARKSDWTYEPVHAENGLVLPTLRREPANPRRRFYISAGIHGDEPAGPLAIRQLLKENEWPQKTALWLCPCLNPSGFPLNRRENADGLDLNRQYLHLHAAETRAHIAWLKQQPNFDMTLCLHEDWEALGFYLYEINLDNRPSPAEEIIRRVEALCPIDRSEEIEGRPASGGVVRPSPDPAGRPQWPEAFWLLTHKTRLSSTLEAPSDFPLATRVAALVTAVRTVLEAV